MHYISARKNYQSIDEVIAESKKIRYVCATGVVLKIAELEYKCQREIYNKNSDVIVDEIMRAWGLLTNAHMISSEEAVGNLALLKLGACLNIIKFKNQRILDDLFFVIQPMSLAVTDNRASSVVERDKIRAKSIAQTLNGSRVL
ncbi:MAG: hypothetical protein LBB36_04035 [Fibromonadaceae bacterium]|nr:hypothetical protein [Fibromonadaceae bacterium]